MQKVGLTYFHHVVPQVFVSTPMDTSNWKGGEPSREFWELESTNKVRIYLTWRQFVSLELFIADGSLVRGHWVHLARTPVNQADEEFLTGIMGQGTWN